MRVVAISTLREFWTQPGRDDAKEPLQSWYAVVTKASWASPAAVKAQYGNASIVGGNRVVFNVAGNKYRLIVAFAYRMEVAYVKFVGTHAEYDKVDAATGHDRVKDKENGYGNQADSHEGRLPRRPSRGVSAGRPGS